LRITKPKQDRASLVLKVLDAYVGDLGKSIARIDHDSMTSLGLSAGDLISIQANGSIVARCLPRNSTDKNIGNAKGIVRIDHMTRGKIGVSVGYTVIIRKVQ